jgi:site-specific recombinase XerD
VSNAPQTLQRQHVISLLAGDASTIQPSVYDRFEAWWYGASANTRRAFAADLRGWQAFCISRMLPSAPASSLLVRDYCRHQHRQGRKAATIARHLASIAVLHALVDCRPCPTRDPLVRSELRGIRKEQAISGRGATRQAKALRRKGDVADIFADNPEPLSILGLLHTLPASPAGVRDRVILQLGADLGRRRSEYVALNVGDIAPAADGSGVVLIRRSKTDQDGEGQLKYVSPESMAAITAWLALREDCAGSSLLIPVKPPPVSGKIAPRNSGMMSPPCEGPALAGVGCRCERGFRQASGDDFVRRMLSPTSSRRWALWTRRSRMASA